MSEWTWLGTLGIGLTIGFFMGRWSKDPSEAPLWQRLPFIIASGFRAYMALIYFGAFVFAMGYLVKDVFFPDQPTAAHTDPAPLP